MLILLLSIKVFHDVASLIQALEQENQVEFTVYYLQQMTLKMVD